MQRSKPAAKRARERMRDRVCSGPCGANWGTDGPLPSGVEKERLGPGQWRFLCLQCRRLEMEV